MRQHKILREKFGINSKDVLENQRRFTKEDRQNGFSVCETWSLDYSFVCWLAERVYLYKEVGGKVVDLEYQYPRFHFKDKDYNQAELIDILLKKCKKWLQLQNWDDEADLLLRDICDIWKELLPAMWW